MEKAIQVLLAKQSLYELSCQYMRGLDRLDAKLLHSVFFADAYCEYGFINCAPAEFIDFAINALREHQANQHMIGNVLIEVEGDEAFGEVYFNAYHKVKIAGEDAHSDGAYQDIIIAGRYLDRYEQRDGVWKIAYRSERVDWSHSRATHAPYFEQVPNSLFGSRQDDAVYDRAARRKKT